MVKTAMNNETENFGISAESVIGDRKYQQDFFMFASDTECTAVKECGLLAIVCDGMGGMEGGETASRVCAEHIYNGYYHMGKADDVCQTLRELVTAADAEVAELTDHNGRRLISGTTVAAAVIRDGKAYWVSVGDSRIYYAHNGQLEQLTRDHNFRLLLQEQCDAGCITQEDVDNDRQREALISYVGKGGGLLIDTGAIELGEAENDMIVLCSDGLYKSLPEEDMRELMSRHAGNGQHLPWVLVHAAMASGRAVRNDNITVLAMYKK